MKHIRKLAGLVLSAAMALSMTVPAFASDYTFTTAAPQDYYTSTSYEETHGSRYNYGGKNVVDYQVPEAEFGIQSTTMAGVMERAILPGLQESVMTGGGSYGLSGGGPITSLVEANGTTSAVPTITAPTTPAQPTVTPTYQAPAYTSVADMAYKDGSIGTVKIPKLGINVKLWEGESASSMSKGVAHYSSTSA